MARYRTKPIEIEAWQVGSDEPMPDMLRGCVNVGKSVIPRGNCSYLIRTLEGDMIANAGDYIIQGVKGGLYLCKPDIFEQTYELVS